MEGRSFQLGWTTGLALLNAFRGLSPRGLHLSTRNREMCRVAPAILRSLLLRRIRAYLCCAATVLEEVARLRSRLRPLLSQPRSLCLLMGAKLSLVRAITNCAFGHRSCRGPSSSACHATPSGTPLVNLLPLSVAHCAFALFARPRCLQSPYRYIYDFDADALTLNAVHEMSGHKGPPSKISYSPDGSMIAVGDAYREIRVWDRETLAVKVQNLWVYHGSRICALAWAADSKRLVSGSLDQHAIVWDVTTPRKRKRLDFAHKDGVFGVAFVGESTVITAGADGCVRTWSL